MATADTEVEWLRASQGKTFREVQRMVSGRTRGDGPTTPKKPDAVVEDVVFRRVEPHARALLSKARESWLKERGEPFTEAELLEGLDRCTWRGLDSFKSYTWASIANANLLMLARHVLH